MRLALAQAEARHPDLQQRLVALVAASGTLFGSPKLEDALPAIIALARSLVPADGYAIWRLDASARLWRIGVSSGVSDAFTERLVRADRGDAEGPVPFADPLVANSVRETPMLAERLDAYEAEGVEAILAAPLTIAGRATGTLVMYFRTRQVFTDVEIQTARALSNLAASAIATAELYDEQRRSRDEAERAERRAAFLADAGAALASSLDYATTLQNVARLAVPRFADLCTVDIVADDGTIERLGIADVDEDRIERLRDTHRRYSSNRESPGIVSQVVRTGRAVLTPEVTDAMLAARARR